MRTQNIYNKNENKNNKKTYQVDIFLLDFLQANGFAFCHVLFCFLSHQTTKPRREIVLIKHLSAHTEINTYIYMALPQLSISSASNFILNLIVYNLSRPGLY